MEKKILLLLILLSTLILPSMVSAADSVIMGVMANLINATRIVAVALVVVFWIITGILFLVAQGAPEKLNTARKSFIWTIVGTALVILAQVASTIIRNALLSGT